MSLEYCCTVGGARFDYDAVRHLARCLDCGAGLWRPQAEAAQPPGREAECGGTATAMSADIQ